MEFSVPQPGISLVTPMLELQQLCCFQSLSCAMPSWSTFMWVLHSVTRAPRVQQTHSPKQWVRECHLAQAALGGIFSLCCKLVRKPQRQTCNIRPDVRDDVIPTAHNLALGQRAHVRHTQRSFDPPGSGAVSCWGTLAQEAGAPPLLWAGFYHFHSKIRLLSRS